MDKTIQYYENNAQNFYDSTVSVDFVQIQNRFTALLPQGGSVLDFGCGSGRDTLFFLEKGFQVEALDGSAALCEKARQLTGIQIQHRCFQDLTDREIFDGIWACASILHVKKTGLKSIIIKMREALKPRGIIYTSFKYGSFEGDRNGRHFSDFTEASFKKFLSDIDGLIIEELWVTGDVRPDREGEKWLNLILRSV